MGYLWQFCDAVGLAPLIRKGYLFVRVAPNGWRVRSRLGDVEAEFAVRAWPEFRRVTTFLGEKQILESFVEALETDDVVWDVGANVGVYACFAARELTGGRVVAFEPEPTNEARLATNLRANAPSSRWTTVPVALSETDGVGVLAPHDEPASRRAAGAGHHYLADGGGRGRDGEGVPVRCSRGDSLVEAGYPAPTALKLDVQGAELKVLRGLGETLADVETVFLELHPSKCDRYQTTADAVERFLADAGFSLQRLGGADYRDKTVSYVRASR